MEEGIVRWIDDLRKEGIPVSAFMLDLRAKEVAKDLRLPDGSLAASWHWRRGFMRRHYLSLRCKTH